MGWDRIEARKQAAKGNGLCCAKIPFSFEVDRYNGQPANNRLTFIIYALLPERSLWYAKIPYDFKLGPIRETNHPLILYICIVV